LEVLLKVYTYSRVATEGDDRALFQEKNMAKFCEQKGCEIAEAFSDVAPDDTIDRPGLSRMLENLQGIEGVVVYSIDRLTRNPAHLEKIQKKLKEHKVKLIILC
jgi:DNA invertase Pin-like site-specific DNA recombinase